ncbi:MAG: folylpolyglutamate synthase/dihydrofolate synthase family protein [Deinococcus sp.]|nr:folylpolyglutamate synthase/dihydrofolate synthase family protein [Deinococcus sp.]
MERVEALLARLGHPDHRFRSVLVGGTNGKGSVAASLAATLQAAGHRTGLFTSPHLTHFAERFCVNGRPVAQSELLRGLREVRPHAEAVEATFFEIVTALGCWLFARAGAEWAVMEVGLGGRLDATNALNPELSVVTNVGLDHTEVLGNTLQAIAAEKAGILRAGRPAVTAAAPALWPVLQQADAELWALGREFSFRVTGLSLNGAALEVQWPGGGEASAEGAVKTLSLQTPLLGAHGAANAALAAVAALRLGVDQQAVRRGLAQTQWPGRLEYLTVRGQGWLLDGAHNPDGAQALADTLEVLGLRPVRLIFGASADKALEEMVQVLSPLVSDVVLAQAQWSPRAATPQTLRPLWEAQGIPLREAGSPAQALELAALSPTAPGVAAKATAAPVVVCGSLYLIGEVRGLLLEQRAEERERWQ